MGVLTQYLLQDNESELKVIEIDRDSVAYLKNISRFGGKNYEGDFIEASMQHIFPGNSHHWKFSVQHISQIFFKTLKHLDQVDQVVDVTKE